MDAVTSAGGNDDQAPVAAPTAGEFLRSRRERLSPGAAGLPSGGRRRTPGLRREELALIAGISVDYLTRLEQGRENNPSHEVLRALSRALQLDLEEWAHLVHLLGVTVMDEQCTGPVPPQPLADATVALLDHLDPAPAFILAPDTGITAWNRSYHGLMRAAGLFDLDRPNLLRFTFLAPGARTFFIDWEAAALHQVGTLRAAVGRWSNDDRLRELVGELSVASPDFANMWSHHEVATKKYGQKHFNHPTEGELHLEFQALQLPDGIATMVTYTAVDTAGFQSLERLAHTGRAGQVEEPTSSGPGGPRLHLVREHHGSRVRR